MIEPAERGVGVVSRMMAFSSGVARGPAACDDQLVHAEVGLVQPEALQVVRRRCRGRPVLDDHVGDHRHDFLEHLAAFLHEQLVAGADAFRAARFRKPKLLRMLFENWVFSFVPRMSQPPVGRRRRARRSRRCDVAEDEVAVAVA